MKLKSEIYHQIIKGSMWGAFGAALSRVLILGAMIVSARALGAKGFGEFGLLQSTMGVIGMMAGTGLGGTATRYVAKYIEVDNVRAGEIISFLGRLAFFGGVFFGVIVFFGADQIAIKILKAPQLAVPLSYGGVLVAVNVSRALQAGVLIGLKRYRDVAELNVVEGVLIFSLIFLLTNRYSVSGAIIGMIVGSFSTWIWGQYKLHKIESSFGIFKKFKWTKENLLILRNYTLPTMAANAVASPVIWYVMKNLSNSSDGMEEVAIYNAAYQWHGPIIFIPMAVVSASVPILVREWTEGRRNSFRAAIFVIMKGALGVTIVPVIILSILSPYIMEIYGEVFKSGWLVLVLMLFAAPIHAISNVLSGAMQSMGRVWVVFFINIIWALAYISVFCYFGINGGAIGMAAAFISAYVVQAAAYYFVMMMKISREI